MSSQQSMAESAAYFRRGLRRNAKSLLKCLDDDMPPLLIARFVHGLMVYANGLCGEELWRLHGEWLNEVARQRSAFCQHCDAQCPVEETHPFVCEQCDRKIMAELDGITGGDG